MFIFSLSVLILVALGTSYAHVTLVEKISIVKANRAEENQNKNIEFEKQVRDNLERLKDQEQKLRNTFIASNDMLGFIQRLEASAVSSGLAITIEKVTQDESADIAPVSFAIQLIGEYSALSRFVSEVLSYDKKLSIDRINLNASGEEVLTYTARIILEGKVIKHE